MALTTTSAQERLRLPRRRPARPRHEVGLDAPVVFFVPARNEAPRLGAVLDRVPGSLDGRPVIRVVVDDGSTDDTVAVAHRHDALVVSHGHHRGLGAAVRTGFDTAVELGAALVAFCDGDGEYDPSELPLLAAPILSGRADYVVGSRFTGEIHRMHPHRRLGNRLLTRWVRWTVRQPVTDGQSGLRALSAAAVRQAEVAHDYNYAQVLTVDLLAKGFVYAEVPITYRFRASGRSFIRLGRYLRRVLPTVRRQLAAIHRPHAATPTVRTSEQRETGGDGEPVAATGRAAGSVGSVGSVGAVLRVLEAEPALDAEVAVRDR